MKLNEFTYIFGQHVVLVPYKKDHVESYHEWMKSPELQQLTGSEPLSLEQEYEMQQTWLNSEDKLTFIILERTVFDETQGNEIASMIGDTNIFFSTNDEGHLVGEAEIMIAPKMARGQKRGWEAMILMMNYAVKNLPIKYFEAKIVFGNEASIKMFQKLGFQEITRNEVFKEITFRKDVCAELKNWLINKTSNSTAEERNPDEKTAP